MMFTFALLGLVLGVFLYTVGSLAHESYRSRRPKKEKVVPDLRISEHAPNLKLAKMNLEAYPLNQMEAKRRERDRRSKERWLALQEEALQQRVEAWKRGEPNL